MYDYFVLGCLIFGILCTLSLGGLLYLYIFEDTDDDRRTIREGGIFWTGLLLIIAVVITYKIYQHLEAHAAYVFVHFAWWYLLGFLLRIPLLLHRGDIFHQSFSTDRDEIFKTFFTVFLGPFQLFFTIWGIWKHKPWR